MFLTVHILISEWVIWFSLSIYMYVQYVKCTQLAIGDEHDEQA